MITIPFYQSYQHLWQRQYKACFILLRSFNLTSCNFSITWHAIKESVFIHVVDVSCWVGSKFFSHSWRMSFNCIHINRSTFSMWLLNFKTAKIVELWKSFIRELWCIISKVKLFGDLTTFSFISSVDKCNLTCLALHNPNYESHMKFGVCFFNG